MVSGVEIAGLVIAVAHILVEIYSIFVNNTQLADVNVSASRPRPAGRFH